MDLLGSFLLIAFLILMNGVFVAAEFAIIGVRATRIEQLAESGHRTAIGLREIVRTPTKIDRYVATAQIGITLASLGLGMVGEPFIAGLIEQPLHDWFGLSGDIVHTISFLLALTLITYLHVVLGEMVPKSLALQNPERMVLLLAGPMAIIQRIFSVAVTALNQVGMWVLHLLRVPPPSQGSRLHTPDELELIVSESFVGGLLEEEEQQLVANIFDFSERRVSQVMTPRVHIDAVPVTVSETELLQKFFETNHSRIPVYEDTIDRIIGVVHIKDLVHQQVEGRPFDLSQLLHDVPAVPESMYAEALLSLFKRQHVHMAVVLDEYGGTAGIVTLEDLIEEVVGEVRDEFDVDEQPPLVLVNPGHLIVQGSVPLDDLREHVDLGSIEHEVESVGGLVLAELNQPAKAGDEITINNIQFRVEEVDGLTVERVSIRFTPREEPDE